MPIPESQLSTWSNQGATTSAANTHAAVRRALKLYLKDGLTYEVYLQGSYKNSTNIRGDSDVDVVVELSSTFSWDVSRLDPQQRAAFHQAYPDSATYRWNNFRDDVLAALRCAFGPAVSARKKCLTVAGGTGRLSCDVVPCLEYRHYTSFISRNFETWTPGIVFWTVPEGRMVVNFPKPHYENGVAKNKETYEWDKPVVRMLKNARNSAVGKGLLADGVAPSYFLECFAYNVPSGNFGTSYRDSYCNLVNWWNNADLSSLKCQNGVMRLFGNTPEQWSQAAAKQLVSGLVNLWTHW